MIKIAFISAHRIKPSFVLIKNKSVIWTVESDVVNITAASQVGPVLRTLNVART